MTREPVSPVAAKPAAPAGPTTVPLPGAPKLLHQMTTAELIAELNAGGMKVQKGVSRWGMIKGVRAMREKAKGPVEPPPAPPASGEAPKPAPEPPRITSARKAMMDEDRAALGLEELDSPERRSWETAMAEAHEQGMPAKAGAIAAEVNAKPRALTDTETAGLVVRAGELKNEHAALQKKLAEAKDPAAIADLAAKVARAEQDFDVLSSALRASGTEKGRALAAQKLAVDRDLSLIAVKARAAAAKGKPLNANQQRTLQRLTEEHAALTKKLADLEAASKTATAEGAIKQHAKGRKLTPEKRAAEFAELLAKAKALVKAGCR